MNVTQLARDIGLDEAEYVECLALFAEAAQSDLDALEAAIAAGDAGAAVSASHSIKGAAANLGLSSISDDARSIEEKSREGRLGETRDAVASAVKQVAEIIRFLASEPLLSRGAASDTRQAELATQATERSSKK